MRIIFFELLLVLFTLAGYSCNKDKDQADMKKIQVAAADSLKAYPGMKSMTLTWEVKDDAIKNAVAYCDNGDSIVVPYEGNSDMSVTFTNLMDGNYSFKVFLYDGSGNASTQAKIVTRVYGERYVRSLSSRSVKQVIYENGNIAIIWVSPPSNSIATEIIYFNANGDTQSVVLDRNKDSLVLQSYKPDSYFRYRTMYKPVPNAIDTFYSAYSSATYRTLDLYLLIGQSNMAGRAPIDDAEKDTLTNVYLFTGSGWMPAVNPLNKYSTVRKVLSMQKLGPGYSFARKVEQCTKRKIGLIVNARGGTSIESWEKGYTGPGDYDLYEKAVKQMKKAEKYGNLKGILWHQGEANRDRPQDYMPLLKELVENLRQDIGEDVYFVAGEIGQWRNDDSRINHVISTVPDEIKNADYVVTDGLTPLQGDTSNPHFDTRSQLILGKRYADKILEKVYEMKPCSN